MIHQQGAAPTSNGPHPPNGACPVCGAPLVAGGLECRWCRSPLDDPMMAELSDVNTRLAALYQQRARLVAGLRSRVAAPAAPPAPGPRTGANAGAGASAGAGTQNLLLGLGVLCLMVAAAVFAAVGWTRLGDGARFALLLSATVAAYAGALALVRRGLRATGEAVLVLALLMAAVDTALLGEAVGTGLADARAWIGGLGVITILGALSRDLGARRNAAPPLAGGLIAVVTGLLILPVSVLALFRFGVEAPLGDTGRWLPWWTQATTATLAVTLIVQVVVGAVALRENEWDLRRSIAGLLLVVLGVVWFAGVLAGASLDEDLARASVLAGATVAAALAATLPQLREPFLRGASGLASAGGAATALGAWASLLPEGASPTWWMASAGAALAVVGARGVRGVRSPGVAVVGATVLAVASTIYLAAVPDVLARAVDALAGTGGDPSASWLNWVDLACVAALVTASVAAVFGPRRWGASAAVLAAGALALTVPLAVGMDLLAWSLLLAGVAVLSGALQLVNEPTVRLAAGVVTALTAATSLALAQPTPGLALALLWAVSAGLAGGAVAAAFARRPLATQALAGAAAVGIIAAAAQSAHQLGAASGWVTSTAAVTGAGLAVLGRLLHSARDRSDRGFAMPSEWVRPVGAALWPVALATHGITAAAALTISIEIDSAAPGATALIAGSVAYLALLAIDRQRLWAVPAGVCAQAAEWLLVGVGGVALLEAYTLPGATVLVAVGAAALWQSDRLGSFPALAPGLAMGLVPSTVLAMAEGGPRVLVVLGVGTVLAATGGILRLRAPLVAGAAAVVVLSLVELGPVVASLPRYLTFGIAGAVLLITGATFEQRRAELLAARRRLRALR
ncbi:MAG: hypothetical protein R2754_06095 [Microthrixaceae bacterium]